jgi:hypothetical protein
MMRKMALMLLILTGSLLASDEYTILDSGSITAIERSQTGCTVEINGSFRYALDCNPCQRTWPHFSWLPLRVGQEVHVVQVRGITYCKRESEPFHWFPRNGATVMSVCGKGVRGRNREDVQEMNGVALKPNQDIPGGREQ